MNTLTSFVLGLSTARFMEWVLSFIEDGRVSCRRLIVCCLVEDCLIILHLLFFIFMWHFWLYCIHSLPSLWNKCFIKQLTPSKISSFFQSFIPQRNIIVTQFPLKSTVVDFWTLIYDTECSTVVILEALDDVSIFHLVKNVLFMQYYHINKKSKNTFFVFLTVLSIDYVLLFYHI